MLILFCNIEINLNNVIFFSNKRTNVLYNFTEVEIKVRDATNDEAWGPHGSAMQEIAQYTFTYEHYTEVMSMLWKRMFQEKENWRSTYKVGKKIISSPKKFYFI